MTGELTEVAGSSVAVGNGPRRIAIDPTGKHVYVLNSDSDNISAFSINSANGTLTSVPGSPFEVSPAPRDDPRAIAIDPSGKYAYVVNFVSSYASGFVINETTGALTPIENFVPHTGVNPYSIVIEPSGKYAYMGTWESPAGIYGKIIEASTGEWHSVLFSPFYIVGNLAYSMAAIRIAQ
jgi:6-phosphogluconolactonase (cycloisomerase 2 family)